MQLENSFSAKIFQVRDTCLIIHCFLFPYVYCSHVYQWHWTRIFNTLVISLTREKKSIGERKVIKAMGAMS